MMKPSCTCLFALLLFALGPAAQSAGATGCEDVASRKTLNVMTLNLLFSEVEERWQRLGRIAWFAAGEAQRREPVDVILLQEVVAGPLALTLNSAVDLKASLSALGLQYNLSYRFANGIPGLLSVGNAVLSRCNIAFTLSRFLPIVTEEPFENIQIPLNRQVMMVRLAVPGAGPVHVYNTHLCAFCDPVTERARQAAVMMEFLETVEVLIPGTQPVILGGDFNANIKPDPQSPENLVYTGIRGRGFADTFTAGMFCINPADVACTYGVPGNPYADNPFGGEASRVDYIFFRGPVLRPAASRIVFRDAATGGFVSDHSAVLTTFAIP